MDIKRCITQLESRIDADPGEITPTDQEAAQVRLAWDQFEARGRRI